MRPTRTRRRTWVAVALLPLALLACSDDEGSRAPRTTVAPTTTTTAIPETTTTAPTGGASTTLPPEPFTNAIATLTTQLRAADDFCAIVRSASTDVEPGPIVTPDDSRALFEYYELLFNKLADALPADAGFTPEDADVLRTATAEMMAEAEESGFDPAGVPPSRIPARLDEGDVVPIMQRVGAQVSQRCGIDPGQSAGANR